MIVLLFVVHVFIAIALIGGRIIPSFTRNWLARRTPGPMPTPFGRFDVVEAMAVWDADHRTAFLEWTKNPWWASCLKR